MNPLIVLFIGMLITFFGLTCIVLIVKFMAFICTSLIDKNKVDHTKEKVQSHIESHRSMMENHYVQMSKEERSNLIVAVSAALSSFMGTDNIRIKSIHRLNSEAGSNLTASGHERSKLIAAISAVIAESSGMKSDSFRITSIRRLG